MMIIRNAQLACFADDRRHRFVVKMCGLLRECHASERVTVDDEVLCQHVEATLDRASAYGLNSERDCLRFLNLAVVCGWDFDLQPEHGWMRDLLADTAVSTPGDRLERLLEEYCHRCDIEENNRRLEAEFDWEEYG
ncbi:hypothetical protein [Pseudomonas sp. SDO52101_S400]